MKELLKEERGSAAFFVVYVFLAVSLVFFFAIGIPLLQAINVEFYAVGEELINDGIASAGEIEDANIQGTIIATLESQKQVIPDTIDVLSVFFNYGWVLIIVIITMVLFLAARQQVESSAGRIA